MTRKEKFQQYEQFMQSNGDGTNGDVIDLARRFDTTPQTIRNWQKKLAKSSNRIIAHPTHGGMGTTNAEIGVCEADVTIGAIIEQINKVASMLKAYQDQQRKAAEKLFL